MNTDKKTLTIRIIIFAVIMVGIVALMRLAIEGTQASTQYDGLAQCLTQKGLKFFGAFWCPHCQAEKRDFGGSVKYLPYIECSTPDAKGQTQVCIDNKIESYPTWVYPDPITVTSETDPVVCEIQPGPAGQNPACANDGSQYFKTWTFSDVRIGSTQEPTHTGNTWTFIAGSRTTGEVQPAMLAQFSGCALPTSQQQ